MKLIHDLPENRGAANAIKRAKQMTNFRWTPVGKLPAVFSSNGMNNEPQYTSYQMAPWLPQTGLIYSSVLKHQKFIGFNVSFESFVTALSDPDSVLYKYNVDGAGRKNANCWYGVVCSCFASYVFDMKERWICRTWPTVKHVSCLEQPDVRDLKLLDIVLNTKRHIAVITDILRDESGNVQLIEVSESVLPICRATYFTPDEFRGYWYARDFKIYRKSDTEGIRYTPSPFVRIEGDPDRGIEADPILDTYICNPDILPDQGNVTNYKEDQDIILDLLNDKWDGVAITAANGEKAFFQAVDRKVTIPPDSSFHAPGFYTAKAVNQENGMESDPVSFAVTGLRIAPADGSALGTPQDPVIVEPGSKLALRFSNNCDDTPGMVYIFEISSSGERKRFPVANDNDDLITIEFPEAEETYFVFITAENTYGEYSSNLLYYKTESTC